MDEPSSSSTSAVTENPFSYPRGDEQVVAIGRGQLPAIDLWPTVDEFALPPDRRTQFIVRRAAMQMYMTGATCDAIACATGLSKSFFYDLLQRVRMLHPDGRIWGLRALIPWVRTGVIGMQRYHQAPGDTTWSGPGAFAALLNRHPELDQFIRDRVLKRRRAGKVQESRQRVIDLHGAFTNECRKLGLNPLTDYPFTGNAFAFFMAGLLREARCWAQIFIEFNRTWPFVSSPLRGSFLPTAIFTVRRRNGSLVTASSPPALSESQVRRACKDGLLRCTTQPLEVV